MKVLCVAEKNSISKAVSSILGGGRVQTRDSGYKYVKNYEFTYDFPNHGRCNVVMTAVAGHITNHDFPPEFGWGKTNPGRLFDAPIVEFHVDDQKKIVKNISNLSRSCDQLMIWTDCDREGEHIGYEILRAAQKGNNRMNLENTWRAQFSHLEASHVIRAARNPIRLDKRAIDAVQTRMEIDLRTGASFTRLLTNSLKPHLAGDGVRGGKDDKTVVSYGSCQFPTLGFVVDRYKRYKNFKPEKFWLLKLQAEKDNQKVVFNWKRGHLFDRLTVLAIYERCLSTDNDKAKVTSIKAQPTTKWRPLPLTTVQFQKACSMYFKMSAKESLDIAEKLYQKGFLSYPRTETDIYPKTLDLKGLIQKHTGDNKWGEYAQSLMDGKFTVPRAGRHNDEAHPPIHPVSWVNLNTLTAKEKTVYEYVVRHFLATCSADAKGQTTNVELKWGTETFTASGLMVLERNFLDIFTYQKWESSVQLPRFEMNEELKLTSAEMKDGQTTAPNLLTETELIALMDANGIGTDATIAEHIEKIVTREYVIKQRKQNKNVLVPTTLGMGLVEGFEKLNLNNSLTKPFLRKMMEEELKKICEGIKTKNEVSHEMVMLYRDSFALTVQNQRSIVDTYLEFKRAAEAA